MSEIYDWETQHSRGTTFEQVLDKHYENRYKIVRATTKQQRKGVDRYFMETVSYGPPGYSIRWEQWFSVEYKADEKLHRTGFFFVELRQEKDGKIILGWAQKIMAQVLIVYSPQLQTAWWANVITMKQYMSEWLEQHGTRQCENRDGRLAYGLLVPIRQFVNECCYFKDTING